MTKKKIFVTQPSLPPLSEILPHLQTIWDTRILSNGGPFHQKLEEALEDYLDVSQLALFNNGTIALITALQALGVTGEVITTPFSFAATSTALTWNNVKPIFVDIKPSDFNIDPNLIEAAITPNTTAIVAVHCYGNPCDVEAIHAIAKKHQLKVVYDAAHAFGVKDAGGSILRHGDMSTLSMHATKVFNTLEGGAIICHDKEIKKTVNELKNFGFKSEVDLETAGINGKMNEVSAALGLIQLNHVSEAISKRKFIDQQYRKRLSNIDGIQCSKIPSNITPNYSYFPILVKPDYPISRDLLNEHLHGIGVFSRRYFYPLISNFSLYSKSKGAEKTNLPVANKISQEVLCLPIYPDLTVNEVEYITNFISNFGKLNV